MKDHGPITTPYADCVAPKPSPGSSEGLTFGNPLSGQGPEKVTGKLEEVQYSNTGPKQGSQAATKIPGGGSY